MIEVAHQRRAGLAAGHLSRRAAHIDVDDVGARRVGEARARLHPARLAAGELDDEGEDLAVALGLANGFGAAPDKLLAGGHLRDHEPCAEPRDRAPERQVGDARQGRQRDVVLQLYVRNPEHSSHGFLACRVFNR